MFATCSPSSSLARLWRPGALGAAALALAAVGCGGDEPVLPAPGNAVGQSAPRFSLAGLDGRSHQLPHPEGDDGATLMVFWATWCTPCAAEVPHLNELQQLYAESGLRIFGVAVPQGQDEASVREFREEMGVRYPIVFDEDGAVSDAYGIVALPYNFVVRAGSIVYEGTRLPEEPETYFAELLGGESGAPASATPAR